MRRSGFLLGLSAPAALLTALIHPVVREAADLSAPPAPVVATVASEALPGMRAASIAISPTRVAVVQRSESRILPMTVESQELDPKPVLKQPRRMVREGCETALSSLVGPEARRMTPGRCIS